MQVLESAREITLGPENAVVPDLLRSPSDSGLGLGLGRDVEPDRISVRVGDRPVARRLRDLYELADREMPPELKAPGNYEAWMITHSVSILEEGDFTSLERLGYRVRFEEKPRATVLDVLPQTRFVTRDGREFRNEAEIGLNGRATRPSRFTELLDACEALAFGGEMTLSSRPTVVGLASFPVITPTIQAVGSGSNASEWLFTRSDNRPLVGDQLMMQLVLTSPHQKKLRFTAQVYADVSTFWLIPARLKGEPMEMTCILE
jgi:hypothetical protein